MLIKPATQNRIIGTLLASQSLLSASMILVFSVASIAAVELAGDKAQWAGVPSTVTLIGSALIAYPVGVFMDKFGRRLGLSLGHLMGIGGALLTAWAAVQRSLLLFLVGIFVLGLSRGVVELGRYAASEVVGPDRRARAISLVVLGGTFGSVTGPTLINWAYLLAERFGIPDVAAPWLMAGAFSALGALILMLFLRPDPRTVSLYQAAADEKNTPREAARPASEILLDWRVRLAIGAMVFSQLSMVIVMTITPLHMHNEQHHIGTITWVITGHTLGMFGFSILTGWLADRFGRVRVIFVGGLISTLACALAPLSSTAGWMALTLFLLGLGWNFAFVAGSTLLDDALRPSEKGSMQGTAETMVKVASGAGSLSSGLFFAISSFAMTSWITVIAAMIPVLLVVFVSGRRQASEPMPGSLAG